MQCVDQPLRRPTGRLRRALGWLQVYLGVGVVLAAVLVGHLVQVGIDSRPADPSPAVLPETVRPGAPDRPAAGVLDTAAQTAGVTGSGAVGDGAPAAVGVLIVGWTLVASAGTVGRRRLDEHESARWAADWKRVEPVWSGRVSEEF
jgi:hypothetical protein